ncbi:hypothetical protein TNCV_523611 [Trichonephila clavipes]|nr:hypothetical protein TNCV_523611 [Trichonephila clavipes]
MKAARSQLKWRRRAILKSHPIGLVPTGLSSRQPQSDAKEFVASERRVYLRVFILLASRMTRVLLSLEQSDFISSYTPQNNVNLTRIYLLSYYPGGCVDNVQSE